MALLITGGDSWPLIMKTQRISDKYHQPGISDCDVTYFIARDKPVATNILPKRHLPKLVPRRPFLGRSVGPLHSVLRVLPPDNQAPRSLFPVFLRRKTMAHGDEADKDQKNTKNIVGFSKLFRNPWCQVFKVAI